MVWLRDSWFIVKAPALSVFFVPFGHRTEGPVVSTGPWVCWRTVRTCLDPQTCMKSSGYNVRPWRLRSGGGTTKTLWRFIQTVRPTTRRPPPSSRSDTVLWTETRPGPSKTTSSLQSTGPLFRIEEVIKLRSRQKQIYFFLSHCINPYTHLIQMILHRQSVRE